MSNYLLSPRVQFDTLRSLAFGSISGTYAAVGTAFAHPARMIKIANNTNADLLISFDGSTNQDFVPSNGFVLYDYCSNQIERIGFFIQPIGTTIYVKQASGAAGSGSVYVTVIYSAVTP